MYYQIIEKHYVEGQVYGLGKFAIKDVNFAIMQKSLMTKQVTNMGLCP
jgi:hypothetical protein